MRPPSRPRLAIASRALAAIALVLGTGAMAAAQPVTVYTSASYGGIARTFSSDAPSFPSGFLSIDNNISSIRVGAGAPIAVYADRDFAGRCTTLSADTPALAPLGIDNSISSLRLAWTCEGGAFEADACAIAPCGPGATCVDLPRPAPASELGRTCALPPDAPDRARGKPARQSSTGFGGVAARATDGLIDGVFNAGSVTHTAGGSNGWLEVDLGAEVPIGTVTVYNRTDCCQERLVGARLELALDPCDAKAGRLVQGFAAFDARHVQSRTAASGTIARYLCLRQPASGYLSVAEITVVDPAFVWRAAPWGACSASCGGGTATRAVTCVDESGAPAPDASCAMTRPPSSQACDAGPCPTWSASDWSACSTACGTGTQTRTVACRDSEGALVAESLCTGERPPLQQSCGAPCGMWSWGPWSACPAVGGIQSRAPRCVAPIGGAPVVESACASATRPASEFRPCYAWRTTEWGACSAVCGGGVQTRGVSCAGPGGDLADAGACTDPRPPSEQACNARRCESWAWGPWGACSAPLNGTQIRGPMCLDAASGSPVPESVCLAVAGAKPASESRACHVFSWRAGPWGACTKACGGGEQTRAVTCADEDGTDGPESSCQGARPARTQPCNPEPCP